MRFDKIMNSHSKCFEDLKKDTIADFLGRNMLVYGPMKKKVIRKSASFKEGIEKSKKGKSNKSSKKNRVFLYLQENEEFKSEQFSENPTFMNEGKLKLQLSQNFPPESVLNINEKGPEVEKKLNRLLDLFWDSIGNQNNQSVILNSVILNREIESLEQSQLLSEQPVCLFLFINLLFEERKQNSDRKHWRN